MPKVNHIQTNFTSGCLSPKLQTRIDAAKYYNGAETITNFIVQPQGGVQRRPGTHYVATAKTTKKVRLVRFQFSTTQAYILEFGDLYIRFYKDQGQIVNGGGSPIEVTSPYVVAHLSALQFAQSADVLYITHPSYAPRKLMRFSHTDWVLNVIPFNPPPTYEPDFTYAATLTPGATTGTAVTFTASVAVFMACDVNRLIKYRDAVAIIRSIGGGTPSLTCTADILSAFPNTDAIPALSWYLDRSPQATLTPSVAGPEGASVTVTADKGTFVAGDVGRYIVMNGGIILITAYVGATSITGRIYSRLANTDAQWPNLWTMEELTWTVARGYPAAVALFEDRLYFAGSTSQPQTIWASVTGDYENFARGSLANAALQFTIALGDVNQALWLLPARSLFLGSLSGEFKIAAITEGSAITPTSVRIKEETNYGSKNVTPQRAGDIILFVERTGKKIREFLYSWEADSYTAMDLTFLAEHLFTSPIVDICLQRDPNPIFWMVRTDGKVVSMSYDKALEFYASTLIEIGGSGVVESIASVPSADGSTEEIWLSIAFGSERRIEYFDSALYVDSGLTYTGAPATTVSGLTHLIGDTVNILGDGAVYAQEVVSAGGEVTISPAASVIQVGLPITCTVKTVRPEIQVAGTAQGQLKRWAEIRVRVYQSCGLKINGEEMSFRVTQDLMDTAVPVFSGDVVRANLGWDRDGQITIVQTDPLPCTILAVTGTILLSE